MLFLGHMLPVTGEFREYFRSTSRKCEFCKENILRKMRLFLQAVDSGKGANRVLFQESYCIFLS